MEDKERNKEIEKYTSIVKKGHTYQSFSCIRYLKVQQFLSLKDCMFSVLQFWIDTKSNRLWFTFYVSGGLLCGEGLYSEKMP